MRALRVWHRRAGVAAALVLGFVTLTGIVLNHTDRLGLAGRTVATGWVLDLYGVGEPPAPIAFAVATGTLAQIGDRLYLDAREIGRSDAALVGAAAVAGGFVAATGERLHVFASDGAPVETLSASSGVPPAITAVGTAADGSLRLRANGTVLAADLDALRFAPAAATGEVAWSVPVTLGPTEVTALYVAWRGTGLSLERIVLDLHSGRILGTWGVWLVDAVALLTLALAFTGVWMWLREGRLARGRGGRLR